MTRVTASEWRTSSNIEDGWRLRLIVEMPPARCASRAVPSVVTQGADERLRKTPPGGSGHQGDDNGKRPEHDPTARFTAARTNCDHTDGRCGGGKRAGPWTEP